MILCGVNVLVYAHKEGTPRHPEFRDWLQSVLDCDAAYGVSDLVLSGFVRVVTMPRLWDRPSTPDEALTFASAVRDHPHAVRLEPGERHLGLVHAPRRPRGGQGQPHPGRLSGRARHRIRQ